MKAISVLLSAILAAFIAADAYADPLRGTTWERFSSDARLANLAHQQVRCLLYASYGHEGTSTADEAEALASSAVENLKKYVVRARSGTFDGGEQTPIYMTMDQVWAYDTVDFAAGRLFERIFEENADRLVRFSGLLESDFDRNTFDEDVPYENWPDRASAMFAKESCREVAQGFIQCLARDSCAAE